MEDAIGSLDASQIPLPPSPAIPVQDDPISIDCAKASSDDRSVLAAPQKEDATPQLETDAPESNMDNGNQEGTSLDPREDGGDRLPAVESEDAVETTVPLSEILRIIRAEELQGQRSKAIIKDVHRMISQCARTSRFLMVYSRLYRQLIQCFRTDKKESFASIYAHIIEIQTACDCGPTPVITDQAGHEEDGASPPFSGQEDSWIQRLPYRSQESIVDLLSSIRNDRFFLSDRIARLSSSQLKKLVQPYRRGLPRDSVLNSGSSFRARFFHRPESGLGDVFSTPGELSRDPLGLLLHGIFDRSAGPIFSEQSRRLDIWSSVCAKVISQGKPGSDDFCLAVVDEFSQAHVERPNVETESFLLNLIEAGSFLETDRNQSVTTPQGLTSKFGSTNPAILEFFDRALQDFVRYISDECPLFGAPQASIDLIRAILEKLPDPRKKLTARNFLISRWFCSSYLSNTLTYPEDQGLMLDSHISVMARQRILNELAMRFHNMISDALSPWPRMEIFKNLGPSVQKILDHFTLPSTLSLPSQTLNPHDQDSPGRLFFTLGPRDVLAIANAIFPEDSSDAEALATPFQWTNRSTTSLSDSSTLTIGAVDDKPGTASSSTPSVTETTLTSDSFSYDVSLSAFNASYLTKELSIGHVDQLPKAISRVPSLSRLEIDMPFFPDLWKFTASLYNQGTTSIQDPVVTTFFVDIPTGNISLFPFDSGDGSSRTNLAFMSNPDLEDLTYRDNSVLSDGLRLLAQDTHTYGGAPDLRYADLSEIRNIFYRKSSSAKEEYDYQNAYFWWRCSKFLESLGYAGAMSFFSNLSRWLQEDIALREFQISQFESFALSLQDVLSRQRCLLHLFSTKSSGLRDKMWFISDVKHSSAYEDVLRLTQALKSMAAVSQPPRTNIAGWAKQRIRGSWGNDKVQAQTLEIISAEKDYGGPNKLAEAQVKLTTRWLLQESVENFCRCEERIHRFCYEVQRIVKKLAGETFLDSPVLWSSSLFYHEKQAFGVVSSQTNSFAHSEQSSLRNGFPFTSVTQMPSTTSNPMSFPSHNPRNLEKRADQPLSMFSGNDSRVPGSYTPDTSPGQVSHPFPGHPSFPRGKPLPPSPISPGDSLLSRNAETGLRRTHFVDELRRKLISLLLSDLNPMLWGGGTETDAWIAKSQDSPSSRNEPGTDDFEDLDISRSTMSQQRPSRTSDSQSINGRISPLSAVTPTDDNQLDFPFQKSMRRLLDRMRIAADPMVKLRSIYDLVCLIALECQPLGGLGITNPGTAEVQKSSKYDKSPWTKGIGVPRTRLTWLEEVTANCEERRLASLANSYSKDLSTQSSRRPKAPSLGDDSLVAAVEEFFANEDNRPSTFFRDLQYIAAFVPSSILDRTSEGTAFWTVGLAAMRLKAQKCKFIADRAMQILAYHYGTASKHEPVRAQDRSRRPQTPSGVDMSPEELSRTTLTDAARLYAISALEGDPMAARELGLFYLTHPELVPRVTVPFSKPSEVFGAMMGPGGDKTRAQGNGSSALDPRTFAVAFHWMEFAANAGDSDAVTFFKENKELGQGW